MATEPMLCVLVYSDVGRLPTNSAAAAPLVRRDIYRQLGLLPTP